MGLNEADTRAKLIDPAIHARGWTEDLIESVPRGGDYTLRVKVNAHTQPVTVALIEVKPKNLASYARLATGHGIYSA